MCIMFFHSKTLESSQDGDATLHYESFTELLVNNQRLSSVSEVSFFELDDRSLAKLHKDVLRVGNDHWDTNSYIDSFKC